MQENNIESKEQSKFSEFITDKKKIIICTVSVLVIVLAATMGYMFSVKDKVASWNNKIYSGISIYGVDLSGQTAEEAKTTLESQLITKINNKIINVNVGEQNFQLSYNDINSLIDVDATVEEALAYGKDASLFEKNSMINKGVNRDHMYNTFNMGIGFVLCVDEKDVDAVIKELHELGEKAYEIGVVTAGGEGVCLK